MKQHQQQQQREKIEIKALRSMANDEGLLMPSHLPLQF